MGFWFCKGEGDYFFMMYLIYFRLIFLLLLMWILRLTCTYLN